MPGLDHPLPYIDNSPLSATEDKVSSNGLWDPEYGEFLSVHLCLPLKCFTVVAIPVYPQLGLLFSTSDSHSSCGSQGSASAPLLESFSSLVPYYEYLYLGFVFCVKRIVVIFSFC